MNVINLSTVYSKFIIDRVLKGGSYLFAQSYYEAGDYGLIAIDPMTLEIKEQLFYNNDRVTDFAVYSDSRIAIRSDDQLSVLSFDGTSFSKICSMGIRSPIITGVACNENFAFASCSSKIVALDIYTSKVAQEFPIIDLSYVRTIYATDNYLFARKISLNYKNYTLCVYRINNDYKTNPEGLLSKIDEISSPEYDLDMGRLCIDDDLNIIENGEESNRLVTFDGNALTVVGNLEPFYPTLEFVKHGNYYFTSPDKNLIVLSRVGTTFTEEYRSLIPSKYFSYSCPGVSVNEFFSTRDAVSDSIGRNISKKEIVV